MKSRKKIAGIRRALLCGTFALAGTMLIGPVQAFALDKIIFGTDWLAEGEHGGYYQAEANGIYKRYGLDVAIRPGGPQVNNPQLLASGAVDIVILTGLQALRFANEGVPLVAIAAFYQKNPQILMAHKSQGLKTLADLKGRPIMVSFFARDAFWPWLREKYGFTDGQIRPYTFNLGPFLHDPTAIQQGFVTNEPFTAAAAGSDPQAFLLADYGYEDYAALATVRRDEIETKRDVLQRFVNATILGWKTFLHGDPMPAFNLIKSANPDMTMTGMKNSREGLIKYGVVESGDAEKLGIGAMTNTRWKALFESMVKAGMYKPDMHYKAAYDLSFVDRGFDSK